MWNDVALINLILLLKSPHHWQQAFRHCTAPAKMLCIFFKGFVCLIHLKRIHIQRVETQESIGSALRFPQGQDWGRRLPKHF